MRHYFFSHFYPRPPRGGRQVDGILADTVSVFLSTPSARRATAGECPVGVVGAISIHALREEGDQLYKGAGRGEEKFLSTPSARRATDHALLRLHAAGISIHALREEGDILSLANSARPPVFLSTPSARRATAKTETKSLFSNKLYNILHEFRRALIYNGSKSYPNHAK